MANVSITGTNRLRKALDSFQGEVEQQLKTALKEEADEVVSDAQSRVRVDSGDLKGSISAKISGLTANVRPRSELSKVGGKKHAIKANVNEFGRQSDPGQPYMTPAAEVSRKRWPKQAKKALNRATQ